ncbi:MAG: hypothetical protein ACXWRE_14380 [Pseudobdellovibrionaceae bacterium]
MMRIWPVDISWLISQRVLATVKFYERATTTALDKNQSLQTKHGNPQNLKIRLPPIR